jgi:ankyrin repeat protein
MLTFYVNYLFVLTEDVSALWNACNIGSTYIVSQLLALPGVILDNPAPDGTTAFSLVLAKENEEIVKMLLDSVEPKREMKVLYGKAQDIRSGKSPSTCVIDEK